MAWVEAGALSICSGFLRNETCEGFINSFADLLINNLLALNLRPDYLCTHVVQFCPSSDSGFIELNATTWNDQIMADKQLFAHNDDFVDNLYK